MGKILVLKIKTYHVTCPNNLKITFGIRTFFNTHWIRVKYTKENKDILIICSLLIQILVIFRAQIFRSLKHTHKESKELKTWPVLFLTVCGFRKHQNFATNRKKIQECIIGIIQPWLMYLHVIVLEKLFYNFLYKNHHVKKNSNFSKEKLWKSLFHFSSLRYLNRETPWKRFSQKRKVAIIFHLEIFVD